MNKPITTSELFHFTKVNNLLGIIENGFYPRYKLEYTFLSDIFPNPAALNAVPMVCFCDIPPHFSREHSINYGKCGIGLTKDWGYKNLLNPIVYLPPNTKLSDAHAALANSFNELDSSKVKNIEVLTMISQARKSITHLSCFLKQYERLNDEKVCLNKKVHVFSKGRFYDEREWRYVPYDKEWGNIMIISPNDLDDEEKMNVINENLKEYKLDFGFLDITHLIFETEEEGEQIIQAVSKRFNCSEDEVRNSIELISIAESLKDG